jgi:hypothetical protein
MFDLSYKLVSDWNFSTGLENVNASNSFVTVDADEKFSNTISSYSISVVGEGLKRGVYSKSNSYLMYSYLYPELNENVDFESVPLEYSDTHLRGISPQLAYNSADDVEYVIYYDLNIGALRLYTLDNQVGSSLQNIIFLSASTPFDNRVLDVDYTNELSFSFVYDILPGQKAVKFGYLKNGSWNVLDVPTLLSDGEVFTTSLIVDSLGDYFIFVGKSTGIFCYKYSSSGWSLEDFTSDNNGVFEIDAEYSSVTGLTHIAYGSNGEVKYQKFRHSDGIFPSKFEVIDFASSSVSMSIDSFSKPLMTYSHTENTIPLVVYLKYATGSSDGSLWQSFNLDSSDMGFKTGAFSDSIFDSDNNLYIMYLKDGVKLFDGSLLGGFDQSIWRDATYNNDLISSSNPPNFNSGSRIVNFNRDNKEYFYIPDIDSNGLNQPEVFSISFLSSPSGSDGDEQTLISHDGYDIFLSDDGVSLGFRMLTSLNEIEAIVTELPIDELSKISFIYSGYDVKFYIKNTTTDGFSVFKYDINGSLPNAGLPFTIGAKALAISDPYVYPLGNDDFSLFYDGSMSFIKFWKRELSYEEATYDNSAVNYDQSLDPYSDNIDYSTMENGFGINYFYLKGDNISVDDLGGVSEVRLLSYSTLNEEERITNSVDLGLNPYGFKGKRGGVNLLWADKVSGNSDIYMLKSNSNNQSSRSFDASFIKISGYGGIIGSLTNVLIDSNADFLSMGVVEGDYLNITSGTNHIAKKIPIIGVLGKTQLSLGVYFSETINNIGYFIDSNKNNNVDDEIVRITDFSGSTSLNPAGVSDRLNDSHIVWQSSIGGKYGVFYKRYRPYFDDRQNLGLVRLDNGKSSSYNPSIAISSTDVLHVVYESNSGSFGSIIYGGSSSTVDGKGDPSIIKWSFDSYGGSDVILSESIDAKIPKIAVDSNGFIHVVFVGLVSSSLSELYYVNNLYGNFSNPIKITSLTGSISNIDMAISPTDDIVVAMSADIDGVNDIYVLKRDYLTSNWSSSRKIYDSTINSIDPSISVGTNNVSYIFWTERQEGSSEINYAEYDLENNSLLVNGRGGVSTSAQTSLTANVVTDDTNTLFIGWDDSRHGGECLNTEIYRNTLSTLVGYESVIEEGIDTPVEDIDEAERVAKIIVGGKFPEIIPENTIPESGESVDSLKITYSDGLNSYVTYGGESPGNIVLNSRSLTIDIEGLQNTLAYRVKNNDETGAMFSEFYEFVIDKNPNTTSFEWILSSGNSQKEVCIQLYTIQGVTSVVCTTMFLNESDIYDISLFRDDNGSIGESIDTIYNNKEVLTFGNYWVKIDYLTFISLEDQKVVFDVIMQGNDILDVSTEFVEGSFIGTFNIPIEDGVRYLDGKAKIIAKIVDK